MAMEAERSHNLLPTKWSSGELQTLKNQEIGVQRGVIMSTLPTG